MDEKVKQLKSPKECGRLYELINSNLQAILESIPRSSHIDEYDYLMQNRNLAADPEYQKRYCTYWRLYGAGLSPDFRSAYFTTLQTNLNNITNLNQVVRELYEIPTNTNGKRKIHFSISSKLIHMVDPHSAIYDSMVASFFSFRAKARIPVEKISELLKFHEFLIAEYQRVLKLHLLTHSIHGFRERFRPRTFTEEKVIDSLIWAFVLLQMEDPERDARKGRPRDQAREDKEVRTEQIDAQRIATEYHMIGLPHGGGRKFNKNDLVTYIRASGRNYIIQGQQNASLANHTKPHSLDFWLRQFAENPDTKQAVNSVCDDLVATGLFRIADDLVCPDTGRRVKGLCFV